MLKFQCPHCQNALSLKQPKSGRFRPTCNGCQHTFELQIAEDLKTFSVRVPEHPSASVSVPRPAATLNQTREDPPAKATFKADEETRMEMPTTRAQESSAVQAFTPRTTSEGPPDRLGGYRLLKELGRGGLGVVYLAQQLSLNRHVAVKLIQTQLARSSTAVSRFFREAYAAAQLVHHNVVQIYDLGQEGETNFFSMEFVQGQNLAELIKQSGALEPRQAAGYILQAARGLQFAHHQGMVHRDVKPANLMLDHHGVVKVADLGLVKLPAMADEPIESTSGESSSGSIQLTGVGATVGTVNYISPEQADSSSEVDHRADIYSLGCTFYTLLTGKPPFQGSTAHEVLAKHKSQPVTRPELIAPRVDRRLSDVVMKMVEKRPENRYANLGGVITDLQSYLGIAGDSAFAPTQEQVQELEASVKAYYSQPLAQARTYLPIAFGVLGLIVAGVASLMSFRWGFACLSAFVVGPLAAFLMAGLRQQSRVFDKWRELVATGGIKPWIMAIAGGLLFVVVLYALGMLGPWLVTSVLAAGLGVGYYLVIEQALAQERAKPLDGVRQWLRRQRVSGVDEAALQRFVANYSGSNWEEYFEDLFGYEAFQRARLELASGYSGPRRKRFRPWRDALIQRLEQRLEVRRKERDADKLRSIEQKSLIASGMPAEKAAEEADRVSQLWVHEATQWRSAAALYQASQAGQASDPQAAVVAKRARVKAMLAEARSGAGRAPRSILDRLQKPLDLFLGAHIRLILGTLLIVGCAMWIRQNGMFSNVTSAVTSAVNAENFEAARRSLQQSLSDPDAEVAVITNIDPIEPLSFPLFGELVSNFNSGIAGLLLVVSVIFGGWRVSLVAIPLAALIWLGPLAGLPGLLK